MFKAEESYCCVALLLEQVVFRGVPDNCCAEDNMKGFWIIPSFRCCVVVLQACLQLWLLLLSCAAPAAE